MPGSKGRRSGEQFQPRSFYRLALSLRPGRAFLLRSKGVLLQCGDEALAARSKSLWPQAHGITACKLSNGFRHRIRPRHGRSADQPGDDALTLVERSLDLNGDEIVVITSPRRYQQLPRAVQTR